MGCGRVGSFLATALDADGHSVAVIDVDPKAFSRLPSDFSGKRVTGVGMDREALKKADIKDAYAFAAVSSGDNSNIISTRIAQETFHVPHVVARIYDPERAYVYERLETHGRISSAPYASPGCGGHMDAPHGRGFLSYGDARDIVVRRFFPDN